MPLIRTAAATTGIQLQNGRRARDRADGRMRDELAELDGETLLLGIVQMSLIAEEYDLVLEQQLVDGLDGLVRKISR